MSPTRNAQTRRVNGLQSPYHQLQIVTWFIYPLLLLHFYSFLAPILWNETYIPIIVIYSVISLIALLSAIYTCYIDPADENVCQNINTSSPNRSQPHTSTENQIYCHLCETRVHNSSKHCTHCRKCIVKFDHHCKWLNTCIGAKNYRYFLIVLTSVGCLTSISLALSIAYAIESFAMMNHMDMRIERGERRDYYALTLLGVQVISIISSVLLLPLVLLVYQLGGFHMMLMYRGQTTYDFIVSEQKKQREKARKQQQASSASASQQQMRTIPPPKPSSPPSLSLPSSSSLTSSSQRQLPVSDPIIRVKPSSSSSTAGVDLVQLEEKRSVHEHEYYQQHDESDDRNDDVDDDNDSDGYDADTLDPEYGKGSMSEMTSLELVIQRTPSEDEQAV